MTARSISTTSRTEADQQEGGALLFVGAVFCDLYMAGVSAPEVGAEVFADAFGIVPGGVANRAVAAARAGARSALVSSLGDDPLGRHVLELLSTEDGLDISGVEVVPGAQSPVSVSLTGPEDRSFITYEERRAPSGQALPLSLGAVAATHIGIAHGLPSWVPELRASGTTVVGGVGWDPSGEWSPEVLRRLSEIDVFVPNDVEAMRYTRTDSAEAAATALAEHVELAVVTCGPRGAIAVDSGRGIRVRADAPQVDVVDPTGAGDVFVASLMSALYGWGANGSLDLERALRLAALSASISVTGFGGATSAPRRSELHEAASRLDPTGDWGFLLDLPALAAS